MQQHFKKADWQEKDDIAEEIERMGKPFPQGTEGHQVQPLRGEGKPAEEIGRAHNDIEKMSQVHGQHNEQNFQPDVFLFLQHGPAENNGQKENRVDLRQGKTDPGINAQHNKISLPD